MGLNFNTSLPQPKSEEPINPKFKVNPNSIWPEILIETQTNFIYSTYTNLNRHLSYPKTVVNTQISLDLQNSQDQAGPNLDSKLFWIKPTGFN